MLASRIITGFNYDIDVHADCISHELLNLMQTDFQEIICLKSYHFRFLGVKCAISTRSSKTGAKAIAI